ncbi:hypothetical protein DRN69_02895, partial [Candidatus Pacearchaeota archaeon]
KNIKLAINPGWQEINWLKKNPKWIDKFEIFICNQEEAAYFTGIPYSKERKIFKKLDDLVKGIVVMTKGKNGVSVSNGETLWKASVLKGKKIIDATGAGDAFTSAFIATFIKKKKIDEKLIKEAIRAGLANARSVIEYIGTKSGILYKKDLKKSRFQHLKITSLKL